MTNRSQNWLTALPYNVRLSVWPSNGCFFGSLMLLCIVWAICFPFWACIIVKPEVHKSLAVAGRCRFIDCSTARLTYIGWYICRAYVYFRTRMLQLRWWSQGIVIGWIQWKCYCGFSKRESQCNRLQARLLKSGNRYVCWQPKRLSQVQCSVRPIGGLMHSRKLFNRLISLVSFLYHTELHWVSPKRIG